MATHVQKSSVTREVSTGGRHNRPLMVTLAPEGIYLREKGRRTRYLLPYGSAQVRAADMHAQAERAAKKAAAKERKRQRAQGGA